MITRWQWAYKEFFSGWIISSLYLTDKEAKEKFKVSYYKTQKLEHTKQDFEE